MGPVRLSICLHPVGGVLAVGDEVKNVGYGSVDVDADLESSHGLLLTGLMEACVNIYAHGVGQAGEQLGDLLEFLVAVEGQ